MTPTLTLHDNSISTLLLQADPDSAKSLASLINSQPDLASLDSVLITTIDRFLVFACADPSRIDILVSFLSSVATEIEPSITHPGQLDHPPPDHLHVQLHPASGPEVLAERLCYAIHLNLINGITRSVTPAEKNDRLLCKQYYADTSVFATILARAFVIQTLFRNRLWRVVEDVIVKCIFEACCEPEPGVYVALPALLLGAGDAIQDYLSQDGNVGRGKEFLWYNDEASSNETWGWLDIVEGLSQRVPEAQLLDRLPDFVKTSIEVTKNRVLNGDDGDWDSAKLAGQAFAWVGECPSAMTSDTRTNNPRKWRWPTYNGPYWPPW